MFTAKQALGDKLPPTRGSLVPAIKRANLQAFVWSKDDEPNAVIPNPVGHGQLANNMPCTQMCSCNADQSTCDNLHPPDFADEGSDEVDSDDADL